MRHILLLLVITIALSCSCRRDPAWQALHMAESIMEEQPDSALAVLENIDGGKLKGEARARHALLLTQARNKNFIDETDDSLISIAVNYYNRINNTQNQMMSRYYWTVIHMNQHDYDGALYEALNVEQLATRLDDRHYLARVNLLIARAYLFSYNLEGAEEYFNQSLLLSKSLNNSDWIGTAFYNLANLELYKQNFDRSLTYMDSVKNYLDYDEDVIALEIFSYIGLNQYEKADSVYVIHKDMTKESPQLHAYHLLSQYRMGKGAMPSYELLFSNCATHYDSLDVAFVANQIAQTEGDFKHAFEYTDLLRKESDKVISELSNHSLYQTKIEHDNYEKLRLSTELQNKKQSTGFIAICAMLVCIIFGVYLHLLKKSHKEKVYMAKNELLLISNELTKLQLQYNKEIEHFCAIKSNDASTIQTLQEQIQASNIAAQALFMDKYSWIEELGNIFLDADASKMDSNRAMKGLKKRLESVKNTQFLPELIDVINKYRNNLIQRIITDCPYISEAERNIIALLCANLSTRIIAYLLGIQQQSIYNAKSSIKKKLKASGSELLQEMSDIFSRK